MGFRVQGAEPPGKKRVGLIAAILQGSNNGTDYGTDDNGYQGAGPWEDCRNGTTNDMSISEDNGTDDNGTDN